MTEVQKINTIIRYAKEHNLLPEEIFGPNLNVINRKIIKFDEDYVTERDVETIYIVVPEDFEDDGFFSFDPKFMFNEHRLNKIVRENRNKILNILNIDTDR